MIETKTYTEDLMTSPIVKSLFDIIENNMRKIIKLDESIESTYSQWYHNCIVDFNIVRKGTTIVAFEGDKVCGYLQFFDTQEGVCWAEMQIAEEHQGDGFTFRKLIEQYLLNEEIKDKDIWGNINNKNDKSKAVFSKLGFCPILDTKNGKRYVCKYSKLISYKNNNGIITIDKCELDFSKEIKINQKLAKIFEFYVIMSPCENLSARKKTIEEYGWKNPWGKPTYLNKKIKEKIKEKCSNKKRYFSFDKYEMTKKTMREAKLLEWKDIVKKPTELMCFHDSQKNKNLSLFYHIRNSLCHGRFTLKKIGGETYYFMEDIAPKNKLSARMVIKEETLLSWIKLIQEDANK